MRYLFLLGGLVLASAGHAAVRVTDVSLGRDARGWRVDVKASEKAAYTVHALPSPNRLIIDVPNATLTINSRVKPVASGGGPALRFSQFSRKPDSVRIVVDLPNEGKWFEISSSPAMSIAVALPAINPPAAPLVASKPVARPAAKPVAKPAAKSAAKPETKPAAKPAVKLVARPSVKTAQKPAPVRKPAPVKRPDGPAVLSARDLEREMLKSGPLPAAEKKAVAPSKHSQRRPAAKRPTAKRPGASGPAASSESRSSVSSRDGFVDRSDLMGIMLSLPAGSMALPPVTVAEPPVPAWASDEAVALINAGDCPDALRRRLIEIVSDPAIQTSQYVWGAQTPGQFDCSGLALYVYNGLDVKLPRVSLKQAEAGEPVDRASLRAGDLVFFNTRGKDISHVGIYLGDGRFLHAANPRENLQITALDSPYYSRRFVTARRVYSPAIAGTNVPNLIRQGG